MTYHVDFTERAERDLKRLYQTINAEDSAQARLWFNGLERLILSLDEQPTRGAVISEDESLRHLLYGRNRHVYRVICATDKQNRIVTVLHIRYGARGAFTPEDDARGR
jgi:plasmid stabilization system protein ParE